MILIITIIAIIVHNTHSQKAFIFSSSVGYYNYRQNANALIVYELLKNNGFDDKDIVFGFPQNVGCCEKNPLQGSVSFYDNEYQNINRNIEVDLKFSSISVGTVLDTLRMKYSSSTLNIHRLHSGTEPYFVYLSGHGGDNYFKIRERQALVSQHFEHIFADFSIRYPKHPIFVMIDSCSAVTPFQNINFDGFIALGSSSAGEKSLSYGYDPLLNQPKSDEFTFYLGEFMKERAASRDDSATIKDLLVYEDFSKLKVHAKIATSSKKNQRRALKEFMSKQMKIKERRVKLKLPEQLNQ